MSVEHSFPQALIVAEGINITPLDHGEVTSLPSGQTTSITYGEHQQRHIEAQLTELLSSDSSLPLQQLRRFLLHLRTRFRPFWFRDIVSDTHDLITCGGLADGAQTTVPLPISGAASDLSVFQDGVYIPDSAYTLHQAANLMTDSQASATTSGLVGSDVVGSATLSRFTGFSRDGLACFMVTPSGSQPNIGVRVATPTEYYADVVQNEDYTAHASVRGVGEAQVGVQWFSSSSSLGFDWGTLGTMSASGWLELRDTFTAPATAVYAQHWVRRTTNSSEILFVDCNGVSPGDNERWWLPSAAPNLLEFSSAMAANTRTTASVTGVRLTPVRFDRTFGWGLELYNDAVVRRMEMTEEIE